MTNEQLTNKNIDDDENEISLETLIKNQTDLILSLRNGLRNQLHKIENKIDVLCDRITILEKKHLNNLDNGSYIEFVKDIISVNIDKVKEYIYLSDLEADKELIKYYYFNNEQGRPPIRKVTTTTFEYWADGKWNTDYYGQEITKILANNIRKCWLSIGIDDGISQEVFLKINSHIQKFSTEKYMKSLFKIVQEFMK